jgi:ketosteroid isomerase-like protein
MNAVELVQKMYECFNAGDMATIKADVFHEELIWRLPGHNPLAGVKHGADEVIAFFMQLGKANIQVDLIKIDVFGDDGCIEVHRGHTETTTPKLDSVNATYYKVRDGKLADVQVFMGDQHSADTFFNAIYELKPIPERLA